jgi:hypothetical protein
MSHTRPDMASPQSASVVQPQTPMTHAAPTPERAQAIRLLDVHCTHVLLLLSQSVRPSMRPEHCASVTHSTHTLAIIDPGVARRQTPVGAMQSASRLHVVVHMPVVPGSSVVQERPAGQPFRPSPTPQPSTQRLRIGSQTRPDMASPQSASRVHPQNACSVVMLGAMHARPSGLAEHAMALPIGPDVQSTQRLVSGSHTGVSMLHAALLDGVHWTQAPLIAQAVLPSLREHSMSERQARHIMPSQTGVLPEH